MTGTQSGTNDLWEALYTQNAMRYFRPDPVPDELVWKVIDAAIRAPSGTNLQPWGFVVVRDDALRSHVAACVRERLLGTEQMRGFIQQGAQSKDRTTRLLMTGVNHIAEHFDSAPVFIVPCLHNVTSPAREGLLAGSSIYQAVQNLLLAARGLGLGTLMTTLQVTVPDLAERLKLPENTTPVALIPLGYPARNFAPVKRKPAEEVTHWETWGSARTRA
ncbi:MAG: nitroreductase family protein [Dehalococcoidia bacterium]|nr:nitroreductase family protein [Dehalococcoidia bacterium]